MATTGTATFDFTGSTGLYKVVLGYFDENDGEATFTVEQNSTQLDQFTADQDLGSPSPDAQTATARTVASSVLINAGDTIKITGTEDQGEFARFDYIEFVPILRVEAEDMSTVNYGTETVGAASNGEVLSHINSNDGIATTGTATFNFAGSTGLYTVVFGYFDENDGESTFTIEQNSTQLDQFTADQDLGSASPDAQTATSRTVASGVLITAGDTIKITGTEDAGEFARADFIDFIPVTNLTVTNTLNSGTGSLREAIDLANTNPWQDTITFDASLNGSIITLTTGGELTITDDLLIDGLGEAITISGNNASRVFNIDDSDANTSN